MQGATAVDGNTVYVTPGYTHHVWAYDLKEDNWTRLPDCPQQDAGLSIVCGLLTAVGGRTNDGDVTNTLVSLTESHSKWTEHFPPMPMELDYPATLSTGNHLVVVANLEREVQVMNTTSLRWFFAISLPFPLFNPSLAVCGTELYVLDYKGSVFSCTLLQSSSAMKWETNVWQSLAKVPVGGSTLATLCGQLVAVGGQNAIVEVESIIHLYNPSMDSWHIFEHMPTARYECLVATLPGDTLVVIGGVTTRGRCDAVEVVYPA